MRCAVWRLTRRMPSRANAEDIAYVHADNQADARAVDQESANAHSCSLAAALSKSVLSEEAAARHDLLLLWLGVPWSCSALDRLPNLGGEQLRGVGGRGYRNE